MPAPFVPQDYLETILGPGSSFCDGYLRGVLERRATLDRAFAAYFLNESGDLTDTAFADDLCALDCEGTGTTPPGTGPGDPTIPVPTSVSATDGTFSDRVVVTWSKVSVAISYEIWRGTSSNVSGAVRIGTVTGADTLTFTDSDAEIGTTFTYWVRSVTAAGISQFGTPDTGYAIGEFTAQVTDLTASQGWGAAVGIEPEIYLSFTAVANAQAYNFYRSATNDVSTATLIDSNRVAAENYLVAPLGQNQGKPYFVDGTTFLCYRHVVPVADRFKKYFFWCQPVQMSAGQATAIGQMSPAAADGWASGDGSTSTVLTGDFLDSSALSRTVPGGVTKAWIAFQGNAGCGAGGSDSAGGGGGGGPAFASGLLAVTAGDTLSLVYTPNADPARAPQLTNGNDGPDAEISHNGVPIMAITGGQGGVYDAGGAGAGGAGGIVTLNSVGGGNAFLGRDGLPAVPTGLLGGSGGQAQFGFRAPAAHYGSQGQALAWEGDGPGGGGGSRGLPGASSSATGGVARRNRVIIVYYL